MIPGMSISTFTQIHVAISLTGIAAATVLTSVTGFFFPRDRVLPSHVVVPGLFIVRGFMEVSVFRPDIRVSAARPD